MADSQTKSNTGIDKALFALLAVGLVGAACFFSKLDDVFPAASIDLRLNKEQIEQKAREALRSIGSSDKDLICATTFSSQDYQEIFLEHEYPVSRANELMRAEVPVWLWSTRFCKPSALEEHRLWLTTDGRLNSYGHTIEAERAIPSLSHAAAKKVAIDFARRQAAINLPDEPVIEDEKANEARDEKNASGPTSQSPEQPEHKDSVSGTAKPGAAKNASNLKLIIDGTVKQSNRLDHYFTWEDQSKDYKGGRLRTYIYVSGNIVTEFSYALHVPDSFERKYNHIRSYNDLLSSIAEVLFSCLTGALLFVFVWALSTGQVRWRLTLVLAFLASVGTCLNTANNWPVIVKGYTTTRTFQNFLFDTGINTLVQALIAGLSAIVLIGGTEALYRRAFPDKLMVDVLLKPLSLRCKQLHESLFAGLSMFGVQLGWITFYYLTGRMAGVWSPLQMREVAVLSSVVPAWSSFSMAVEASVFEELLCRVLCLVLVQKLTRNFWIANFVQAVGWAFMHSNYPQEPAYVRGVELSFVGFAFGMLLRRFGILPSIVSHFTYNCLLGVLPLLSPNTPLLLISALVAISPAFIWFLLSALSVKKKGYVDESALLNSCDSPAPKKNVVEADLLLDYHYSPVSRTYLISIATTAAISVALCFLPVRQIGQDARLAVSREQALENAKGYLKSRGIADDGWQITTQLRENLDNEEIQYGFEKEGLAKVTEVMRSARYPLIWYIRFFKPQQPDFYEVMISPIGRPIGLSVHKADEAEGETLSEADARAAVEQFMESDRPEFHRLNLGASSQTKRDKRVDHTFIYEAPEYRLGDARLRVSISTVGAEVDRPYVNWDIPSAWTYERSKKTFKDEIVSYANQALLLVSGGLGVAWLVGLLRSQSVHWRPALMVAILYAITSFGEAINEAPLMLLSYSTDIPLASFWVKSVMERLRYLLVMDSAIAFLGLIGFASFRLLRPRDSITAFFRKCISPQTDEEKKYARNAWIDALVLSYSYTAILTAIDRTTEWARGVFSPSAPVAQFGTICDASTVFSPSLDIAMYSLSLTLVSVVVIPIVVGLYARYCRTWTKFFIGSIVVSAIVYASNRYWQSFLIDMVASSITTITIYWFVRRFARDNILTYVLCAYVSLMTAKIIELARFGSTVYSVDIAISVALALLPILLGVFQINSCSVAKDTSGDNQAG